VALGPCADGGFYAIAARRTEEAMFAGVEWSSGRERGQTIEACRRSGLTVECGGLWDDVDTPADLPRLKDSNRATLSADTLRSVRICT